MAAAGCHVVRLAHLRQHSAAGRCQQDMAVGLGAYVLLAVQPPLLRRMRRAGTLVMTIRPDHVDFRVHQAPGPKRTSPTTIQTKRASPPTASA